MDGAPPLSPAVQRALELARERAAERKSPMTTAHDVLVILMGWQSQPEGQRHAEQPST